jgi:hypothetical protein
MVVMKDVMIAVVAVSRRAQQLQLPDFLIYVAQDCLHRRVRLSGSFFG